MASQTILSSISQGELIFSWSDFIIKVEIYGISSHSVLISGRGNLSLGLTVVLCWQNLKRAPYILLYATRLAEKGPIVLHNNTLPLMVQLENDCCALEHHFEYYVYMAVLFRYHLIT